MAGACTEATLNKLSKPELIQVFPAEADMSSLTLILAIKIRDLYDYRIKYVGGWCHHCQKKLVGLVVENKRSYWTLYYRWQVLDILSSINSIVLVKKVYQTFKESGTDRTLRHQIILSFHQRRPSKENIRFRWNLCRYFNWQNICN